MIRFLSPIPTCLHMLPVCLFILACSSGTGRAQLLPDQVIPKVVLPNGNALLQGVRDRLPHEPLTIQAILKTVKTSRTGGGWTTRVLAESTMDFGAKIPHGSYTIFEHDKSMPLDQRVPIEKAEVTWDNGNTQFTHFDGPELKPNPNFTPTQKLKNTPFTWYDLSLSFLWWPNARTISQEAYMQGVRKVWVVDVPAPASLKDHYSKVRLHIDQVETLVHEAEVFDAAGEKIREIKMKGIQDIDGLYMFKDMAIKSWPDEVKTSIIVQDLVRLSKHERTEPVSPVAPVTPVPIAP